MKFEHSLALAAVFTGFIANSAGAFAQYFDLETVPDIAGPIQQAVDISDSGYVLGIGKKDPQNGGKDCPFVYRQKTNERYRLCDFAKIKNVYAINNAGQVVGSVPAPGGSEQAFIWTRGHGIKLLGFLKGDNKSVALDINDHGQVVGYSGQLLLRDGSEDDLRTFNTRGFLYDSKNKLRAAMPRNRRTNIALHINQKGNVLTGTSVTCRLGEASQAFDAGCAEGYDDYWIAVANGTRSAKSVHVRYTYGKTNEPLSVYGSAEEMVSRVGLNNSQQVVAERYLINLRKGTTVYLPGRQYGGRSDYGAVSSINDRGDFLGWANGAGYLTTAKRSATTLQCLFPRNQGIAGAIDTIRGLEILNAPAINKRGDMVVSGLLANDASQHVIVIKPRAVQVNGIYDYCPVVLAEAVGDCGPHFSSYTLGSEQDVHGVGQRTKVYQSEWFPDYSQCSFDVTLSSDAALASDARYSNISVGSVLNDESGPGNKSCAPRSIATAVTDVEGKATMSFVYTNRASFDLGVIMDPRFAPSSASIDPSSYFTGYADNACQ